MKISLRFESHYTEPRGQHPPQNFTPMLREDERVVSVETLTDDLGHVFARVWIAREED